MSKQVKFFLTNILNSSVDWKIQLLKNWKPIVGSLSNRIRLEKICDSMLIIGVYESHWMQELFLLSKVLLNNINKYLGKDHIKQLKFKLVEKKINKKFVESKIAANKKNIVLTSSQENALNQIKDEKLKNALKNFWTRCIS